MQEMAGTNLEYADVTVLHPLALALLILCIVSILVSKRRYALVPLLLLLTFIPSAQRITVVGLDFTFVRLAILFLLLRVIARGEFSEVKRTSTDNILIAYALWGIIAFGILYATFSSVVTRVGYMVEAGGAYFVGRALLRDWSDVKRCLIAFSIMALPLAFVFVLENQTGRNLFSIFGGVPEITKIRDGRVRSQGPFSHPIVAGVFWATMLPFILAYWRSGKANKVWLLMFFATTCVIVLSTASSTPIIAIMLAFAGTGMYLLRDYMRVVTWGTIGTLVVLQLVMSAPVWHLLARVNVVGGSTGWHRYYLIDKAVEYFPEWALIGTQSTRHWGSGLRDVTNQYILEGVRGGIIGFMLFALFIRSLIKITGENVRNAHSDSEKKLYWCLWALMFMHMVIFLAMSYFGTVVPLFYLTAGGIVSLCALNNSIRN